MNKRIILTLLLIVASLTLVGWGNNSAELFHRGKIIDLNKAIEFARPGGDADADNETNAKDEPSSETTEEIEGNEITRTEKSSVKIYVRYKSLTIEGDSCDDLVALEEKIRQIYNVDTTYVLVDVFAESHRYKEVKSLLDKLGQEIGLKYSVE